MMHYESNVVSALMVAEYVEHLSNMGRSVTLCQDLIDSLTANVKMYPTAKEFLASEDGKKVVKNDVQSAFIPLWSTCMDRALHRVTLLAKRYGQPDDSITINDDIIRAFCQEAPDAEVAALSSHIGS